jgi:phosphoserine aminotransferase
MTSVHNFSAGPAVLPREAIEESISGLRSFKDSELSVLEISHRSSWWGETMEAAEEQVRKLLNVPDNYSVLFLQGGANMQFGMVPYNLLPSNETAVYVNTGTWADKAIKDAKIFGHVNEVASSKESNFNYIPKDYTLPEKAAYLHITPNNTIFGTQMKAFPNPDYPVVADMSSELFSRPIDVSQFDLIYGGAQKNMGPAGVTVVIVNKDILGRVDREIPGFFDYRNHVKKESLYNTPPVYPIYMSYLTMRWVEEQGGVKAMKDRNDEKARMMYEEIDRNSLFEGTAAKEDRSVINATFVAKDEEYERKFLKEAAENNFVGLKGHRSVGGFRASMYNALPRESVEALVGLMQDFESRVG